MKQSDQEGFRLIPISGDSTAGADESPLTDEEQVLIDRYRDAQKELLEYTSYKARRPNLYPQQLHHKAGFILMGKLPVHEKQSGKAVAYLLADQGALFSETAGLYRSVRINNKFTSDWKRLSNPDNWEKLFEALPAWQNVSATSEGTLEAYRYVTKSILRTAREHRKSLKQWTDAYFAKEYLARWDAGLDESRAYIKDHFPKYAAVINCYRLKEILRQFWTVADPASAVMYEPANAAWREVLVSYQSFSVRLERLNTLYDGFHSFQSSLKPSEIDEVKEFPVHNAGINLPEVRESAEAVFEYYASLGRPLDRDMDVQVAQRISGTLHKYGGFQIQKPLLLLYMLLVCGRRVATSESTIRRYYGAPYFNDHIPRTKQRYEQLAFLCRLFDIFKTSQAEQVQCFHQFLAWQGKAISSEEELQFWHFHLCERDYEQFSAIGFQLCCLDYIQDCMPFSLTRLAYDSTSRLHLGGFRKFWEANEAIIRANAIMLPAHLEDRLHIKWSNLRNQYLHLWNDPKQYFYEGKQWLDELSGKLQMELSCFVNSVQGDETELMRLILETEIQLRTNQDAREKLLNLCQKVYCPNFLSFIPKVL